MFKIAIIGTENTHARAFAEIIHKGHPMLSNIPYADFEVVGVCGDNDEENAVIREITGGRAEISKDPDTFVGKVDAVMVTCRHGAKHFPSVKKYIEAGIPAFIDKPITIDPAEAVELCRLAKKHNTPICGGSTCGFVDDTQYMKMLRNDKRKMERIFGGSVSAPVSLKNDYGNFFFYSQHLVQIMTEVFGHDVKSILARGREDAATFIARYPDYDVTGHYGTCCYSATIYEKSQVYHRNISLYPDIYLTEFRRFEHMVRTRKMPESYEELITPTFILDAINKSLETGEEVEVRHWII